MHPTIDCVTVRAISAEHRNQEVVTVSQDSRFPKPRETPTATPLTGGGPPWSHEPPPVPDHEMLRCIGRGAFGEVWLARTVMGAYRAVKVVYRDAFEHERPFEREFEGIRRFEPVSREHPSQIAILHVGRNEAAGCFYYVMELADEAASPGGQPAQTSPPPPLGTTLARAVVGGYGGIDPDTYLPRTLKYEQHRHGRLSVADVLRLGTSLATALDHLHRHGLVHRDIKPSNIIFVNGAPKLADVGLVATVDASMSVAGTPGYMPPEGAGTPKGDLYSLGKVLYELATGNDRQAFPALPRAVLESDEGELLRELSAVLDKACDGDPARRYETVAGMHADLALIQSGRSVRRSRRLEKRQRSLVRAAAVLLATAVIAAGGLVYWKHTAEKTKRALAKAEAATDEKRQALEEKERALRTQETTLQRYRMANYAAAMGQAFYAAEDQRWPEVFRLLREQIPTNGAPDLRGWEWRYLEGVAHRLRGTEVGRWSRAVSSIVLAPDQDAIAIALGDGRIEIRSPDLRQCTATLNSPVGGYSSVAFSPDGNRLYAAGDGGFAAWRRDAQGWRSVTNIALRFEGRYEGSPLAIQPDGKAAFLSGARLQADQTPASPASRDVVVHVARLDLTSFIIEPLPVKHDEDLNALALSPSGRWLASGGGDEHVHLLDLTRPDTGIATARLEATTGCLGFVGESQLVVGDRLGVIHLLSVPGLERLGSRKAHENGVQAVAHDPPSGRLLSAGLDGSLRSCDPADIADDQPDVVGAVEGRAEALAVLPQDGGVLVADQTGGVARFGSVFPGPGMRPAVMVDPWLGSRWGAMHYAASLDEENHSVTIWDLDRAAIVVQVNLKDAAGHVPLRRQYDVGQQSGTRLVVGYDDRTIRLLECAGGTVQEIRRLSLTVETHYPFYYARDERLVAFAVDDYRRILVWDCTDTNPAWLEAGPGMQVSWPDFPVDSRDVIAEVPGAGRMRWRLDPGPPIKAAGPFRLGLPDPKGALEYASNGTLAYSASASGSFLHRTEGWKILDTRRLPGLRTGSVLAVFTPDSSRIIVDSQGTDHLEIIDTDSLEVVGRLPDPPCRGSAQLIMSENGEHLYVGTRSKANPEPFKLHHYHVPPLAELEPAPIAPPPADRSNTR